MEENNVRIVRIDIPFGDLVMLWIKASLAAIPAALVLGALAVFVSVVMMAAKH